MPPVPMFGNIFLFAKVVGLPEMDAQKCFELPGEAVDVKWHKWLNVPPEPTAYFFTRRCAAQKGVDSCSSSKGVDS